MPRVLPQQTAGSDPGQLAIDAHRRQYENFLAALAGQEALRVDLQTNRQSIAIITRRLRVRSHQPPGDPVTTSIGGGKPGAAPAGNALKLRAVIPGRGPGVVSRGEPAMVRCRW